MCAIRNSGEQDGTGYNPVALGRGRRNTEAGCGISQGQPREVAQFDQLRFDRFLVCKFRQSFVKSQQLLVWLGNTGHLFLS